jgi:hypothetical protein
VWQLGVQMRCRECAAEVAVTARACSRCGAPIVAQPPVVADAVVADTVAGAVSDTPASDAADAAGKAVAAGVAGQEPYVPGSGARVPAELRLVLAGYVGVACGLFVVGALACAAVGVFYLCLCRLPNECCGRPGLPSVVSWVRAGGVRGARAAYPVFPAAPAVQRSTHGHGDGLEAWWTHTDTRHSAGWRRPGVPVAVRGSSRVADEGRHADARGDGERLWGGQTTRANC